MSQLSGGDRAAIRDGRPLKSVAFDLSAWHGGTGCVRTFVQGYGGMLVKACCAPCGMLADVEACGTRVSVADSHLTAAMKKAAKK